MFNIFNLIKFCLFLIFFSSLLINKSWSVNINDQFNNSIKISDINFFLPGNNFVLKKKSTTNITEGISFNEFYLTNENNSKIIKSVKIMIGSQVLRFNRVGYISHDKVCAYKNRFYKFKKKSGTAFNCAGIIVGFNNESFKIAQNIYANNYGTSVSSIDQEIINYFEDQKITKELNIVSQHIFFSLTNSITKSRHVAVEYYFNIDSINQLTNINNDFLNRNKNKDTLTESDKDKFNSIKYFFDDLQLKFEKNLNIQKSLSFFSENILQNQIKIKTNNNVIKKNISNDTYKKNNNQKKIDLNQKTKSNTNQETINKLFQLEEMYKSGNLTKNEFDEAKKLLLNK